MKRPQKKLLVPAALALGACAPADDGVCRKDETYYLYCRPDGGYLCGSASCAVTRAADGGPELLGDGSPACMC